jgi:4-hydroxy-3-methylbut-2-enyl diphosphate reductase
VNQLLGSESLDLMLVIGGYNSSNTCNLAHICAEHVPTYHIADPTCLESPARLRHKPVGEKAEVEATNWLPGHSPLRVGVTSGASTPDNLVEQVIRQLSDFANAN